MQEEIKQKNVSRVQIYLSVLTLIAIAIGFSVMTNIPVPSSVPSETFTASVVASKSTTVTPTPEEPVFFRKIVRSDTTGWCMRINRDGHVLDQWPPHSSGRCRPAPQAITNSIESEISGSYLASITLDPTRVLNYPLLGDSLVRAATATLVREGFLKAGTPVEINQEFMTALDAYNKKYKELDALILDPRTFVEEPATPSSLERR